MEWEGPMALASLFDNVLTGLFPSVSLLMWYDRSSGPCRAQPQCRRLYSSMAGLDIVKIYFSMELATLMVIIYNKWEGSSLNVGTSRIGWEGVFLC